jgi:hypothetical protein
MAQEYQIKLSGRLQQGRAPDMALQLLNDLFQIPAAEGKSYFQGRPTTLPRKLDQATAEQLCHRFRNVGVECSSVVAEELDYQLELIQEGPEAAPSQTTTTADNALSAKLQDLTQQLAASEDGLTDSAFVLELIPLEEELTKPLPKVGHIHIPTASPALKQMHGQQQAQGQEQGQTAAGESAAQVADDASAQTPASPSEGGSEEGSDEVIAIGQAMVSGGGAGLGGMLPQASVQPNFRRPDEILAAKPKSKLPLVALMLSLSLLGALGYWQVFMAPNTASIATANVKKTAPTEPAEIDTSQFLPFEIEETKARLGNLGKSLRDWQLKFNAGKGLPQQSDLMPLLKQDLGLTDTDWLDAWKHPIRLQGRVQGYILVSPGLDGKTDTLDDIEFSLDL